MAAATSTSYDPYLIDMWTSKSTMNLVLQDNVAYGLIDKDTSWKGDKYYVPLSYGDTGGFSADFNSAQRNKQPTSETRFELTAATAYSLFSVQRKIIRQSRDKGAVVEVLGRQSAAAVNVWKRLNGLYVFGNGGGALGTLASSPTAGASTTLTLSSSAQTARFEQGMTLQASLTDGTSGVVKSGTCYVSAVDIPNAQLSVTLNTITFASGDYLFLDGTFGSVIKGFDAWIPSTVTSTSFFNVDRTGHKTRLGGQRINAGGLSPRAAAKRAANEIWKAGGKADIYVTGPERFQDLIADLESAGNMVRTVSVGSGKVGAMSFGIQYDAVEFMGPNSMIRAVCDYNNTDDVSWMLTKKSWVLASIGQCPYLDDMGGGSLMREGTADAYEGRWVGDLQLGCNAPGWNCRVNHTVAA